MAHCFGYRHEELCQYKTGLRLDIPCYNYGSESKHKDNSMKNTSNSLIEEIPIISLNRSTQERIV
ncbi:hypothetical protein Glove_227g35 [Diversispora epigaea]|uniref:Uncharacterized protein n=1 Tax=Diversispora epigaea TaxID=1348612 RepID=A0A397IN46_9GLOM|nr:hypothetical protein Glove_227g35 [Diversispora epigaea]